MEKQLKNAQEIAAYLQDHHKVEAVHYLGLIAENDHNYSLYKKQYSSPGAMISFEIIGGEKEAFSFLNELSLIKMAVSLGSTESLAQHPASMTHAGVHPIMKQKMGITDNLIRLSVGIENVNDLIKDIETAFKSMQKKLHLPLAEGEMINSPI
jgi:methionine-gamma-lyase